MDLRLIIPMEKQVAEQTVQQIIPLMTNEQAPCNSGAIQAPTEIADGPC